MVVAGNLQTNSQGRILWVDAMRGFSMFLVVLGHVFGAMGLGGYSSPISSILLTFRMPLFFFVSGFFSFRAIAWWNKSRVTNIIKRKTQAQILSTIIFVTIYQFVMSESGEVRWWYTGFGRYWFTIVLFQMYICYLIISCLSQLVKFDFTIVVLVVISLFGIGMLAFGERDSWIWNFLCWENFTKYFQFFTLGIIASKHRSYFFKLLDNSCFVTISIIGWIGCLLLWYSNSFKSMFPFAYSIVHDIVIRYCALLTVVAMFYGKAEYFSDNSKLGKALRFVGQRTLDIYMIHYFLLPDLKFMQSWFENGNMLVIQLMIALAITICVVGLCLCVSSILRKSPYLASWLFGSKPVSSS